MEAANPTSNSALTPRTAWEQKERDSLLALETDEWREKRHIAESPDTTADTLVGLSRETKTSWFRTNFYGQGLDLIAQAIIAHPNTPAATLLDLINCRNPSYRLNLPTQALCRTLCRNPIASFLCLETPDFWERVEGETCQHLLSEACLPPFVAEWFTRHSDKFVAQSARLHISQAGEMDVQANGFREILESERSLVRGKPSNAPLILHPSANLGQPPIGEGG